MTDKPYHHQGCKKVGPPAKLCCGENSPVEQQDRQPDTTDREAIQLLSDVVTLSSRKKRVPPELWTRRIEYLQVFDDCGRLKARYVSTTRISTC